MTYGREPMDLRFGLGIGISILLHALALLMATMFFRPGSPATPKQYTVDLVDMPKRVRPSATMPVPEKPDITDMVSPSPPVTVPPAIAPPMTSQSPIVTPVPPAGDASAQGNTASRPKVLAPSAIYDKDVIGEVAAATEKAEKAQDDGLTFNTRDMMYRGYMDLLRDKVESIWVYPREAAEEQLFGDLIVRFVILSDGSLGEVKVLRTSGYSILDKAAVKALRDGQPYWPLPDSWDKKSLTITGRFLYTLGGYYVR